MIFAPVSHVYGKTGRDRFAQDCVAHQSPSVNDIAKAHLCGCDICAALSRGLQSYAMSEALSCSVSGRGFRRPRADISTTRFHGHKADAKAMQICMAVERAGPVTGPDQSMPVSDNVASKNLLAAQIA